MWSFIFIFLIVASVVDRILIVALMPIELLLVPHFGRSDFSMCVSKCTCMCTYICVYVYTVVCLNSLASGSHTSLLLHKHALLLRVKPSVGLCCALYAHVCNIWSSEADLHK